MRRTPRLVFFMVAGAVWLAAGPGGETTRALLACRHEAMHHAAGGHHAAPTDGPCFCDQMTGGLDLAVSTAAPTPPLASVAIATPAETVTCPSLFPLPSSPSFAPSPPPPNGLG